jgi:peptidoglycan pentaglycine glycine transferase (the first glycine)
MIAGMMERTKSAQAQPTVDDHTWDGFVRSHPAAHLLQTSGWGALKGRFGWRSERVVLPGPDGTPVGGALVLYRRVAGLTLAYVPRGPLTDWTDIAHTEALIEALTEAARRQGAALLKLEPELPDSAEHRAWLHQYGFHPSPQTIQPPSTIFLDLCGSEAAILGRMKSKWRYNIRLAERKGVTVRTATAADLPTFNALMQATGSRDGFAVHSADYYAAAFDLFTPDQAAFLIAEYEGTPLAALVVAVCGPTAWYLWGASSDRERNRMPNHALQWAAMRWAQAHGATRYDFWGIPDELGQLALGLHQGQGDGVPVDALPIDLEALPDHGLWGVYRFKQGFGGDVVRTVGAWDRPINPVGYWLYGAGLSLRKRLGEIRGRVRERQDFSISQQVTSVVPQSSNLQLVTDATTWRQHLAVLSNPHVLQSWEWGQVKDQTGWRAERYTLCAGETPRAAFQFLWRQAAPMLPIRVGYIPKGPLVDWNDLDLVDALLQQIEQTAHRLGCLFVKIDPDVREDTTAGKLVLHALGRRGWRFSPEQIQFQNTALTELPSNEAALLDAMKQKWRYNIRLAERRGITVREGTAQDLAAFYDLYGETGQRDGFLVRPFSYYQSTWQTFLAAQRDPTNPAGGVLLLAEHADDPQPVAGLFLLRYGERAWYFYGASSERHRRDMPNYLLQWHALRWAQEQGCTVYDWWGAPTDLHNADDPMQGVWQFKQGFGAEFQPHIGAWDFPVSLPLYQLYTQAMPSIIGLLKRRHRAIAASG